MEKIIEIEINNKDSILDKYNSKRVSKELINYIVENTPIFRREDTLKIKYKNNMKEKIDIEKLIKEGLEQAYKNSLNRHWRNDITQIIYLIIGIIGIFTSTLIHESVIKEIVLIGGTVFIWALLEMEIYTELKGKNKRRIIKKLLSSKFEEIK